MGLLCAGAMPERWAARLASCSGPALFRGCAYCIPHQMSKLQHRSDLNWNILVKWYCILGGSSVFASIRLGTWDADPSVRIVCNHFGTSTSPEGLELMMDAASILPTLANPWKESINPWWGIHWMCHLLSLAACAMNFTLYVWSWFFEPRAIDNPTVPRCCYFNGFAQFKCNGNWLNCSLVWGMSRKLFETRVIQYVRLIECLEGNLWTLIHLQVLRRGPKLWVFKWWYNSFKRVMCDPCRLAIWICMCAGSGYSLMISVNDNSLDFSHPFPGIKSYQCHLPFLWRRSSGLALAGTRVWLLGQGGSWNNIPAPNQSYGYAVSFCGSC